MLPLVAAFPGLAVCEVTLALVGLQKEGFVHLDDTGQGVGIVSCTRLQKAMTPAEGRLQIDAHSIR